VDYALYLSIAALACALVALARCFVPPQSRLVYELADRIGELEHAQQTLRDRLDRRSKQENMAKAREVREYSVAERDTLAEQARAILAQQAQAAQQVPQAEGKAGLRRRFGLIK